jgi:hypothetical protein
MIGKSHSHEAYLILYNLNLTRVAENSQSCTFLCCLIIFLITYKNWIIVYKHVYQLCTFSDDVNRKVIPLEKSSSSIYQMTCRSFIELYYMFL